jgi:hypothetical protein
MIKLAHPLVADVYYQTQRILQLASMRKKRTKKDNQQPASKKKSPLDPHLLPYQI